MPVDLGDPLQKRENMLNIENSLAQLRITFQLLVLILGREGSTGAQSFLVMRVQQIAKVSEREL